jgi:hypothetical protein
MPLSNFYKSVVFAPGAPGSNSVIPKLHLIMLNLYLQKITQFYHVFTL